MCNDMHGAAGTPEQMWESLSKFKALPENTSVFCAHEYTQPNAHWAVKVDPENVKLQERKQKIDSMRAQGLPTVPSVLGDEFETNPFLRPHSADIRKVLGVPFDASDEVAFAAIRRHKDSI
jgi:hydroxyacylglutathione hydrolase